MSRAARGIERATCTAAAPMQAGFTLLELSIVLTIIGLIIGGVLTGQSLIQQARLNKVMTDIQKFVTAFQTFQNKYNALPGDMNNATSYWGAAGSPTNTWAGCFSIVGTGTQTCDGNGDGLIDAPACCYTEQYRAWQQLQLAGLIEGSYNGVTGFAAGTNPDPIPGTNVPKGPWNNSGYEIYYLGNQTGTATPYTGWAPVNFGHVIMFGGTCGAGGGCWPEYALLTAAEALSIDTKYDDGLPFSGIISVMSPASNYDPNCTSSPYTSASVYNISYSGAACPLNYVTGF